MFFKVKLDERVASPLPSFYEPIRFARRVDSRTRSSTELCQVGCVPARGAGKRKRGSCSWRGVLGGAIEKRTPCSPKLTHTSQAGKTQLTQLINDAHTHGPHLVETTCRTEHATPWQALESRPRYMRDALPAAASGQPSALVGQSHLLSGHLGSPRPISGDLGGDLDPISRAIAPGTAARGPASGRPTREGVASGPSAERAARLVPGGERWAEVGGGGRRWAEVRLLR